MTFLGFLLNVPKVLNHVFMLLHKHLQALITFQFASPNNCSLPGHMKSHIRMQSLAVSWRLKWIPMQIFRASSLHYSLLSDILPCKFEVLQPSWTSISSYFVQWDHCAFIGLPQPTPQSGKWLQVKSWNGQKIHFPCFSSLGIETLYCLLNSIWK